LNSLKNHAQGSGYPADRAGGPRAHPSRKASHTAADCACAISKVAACCPQASHGAGPPTCGRRGSGLRARKRINLRLRCGVRIDLQLRARQGIDTAAARRSAAA
jgi:hypothetical protein